MSRRGRVAGLAIVTAVALTATGGLLARELRRESPPLRCNTVACVGKVTKVIDGDTFKVDGETVREIGMDTPEIAHRAGERDECFGRQAFEYAKQRLDGQQVTVILDRSGERRDRFGRLLGYAWLGGELVNLTMVREGYATAFDVGRTRDHRAALHAAEQAAQDEGRGLWEACMAMPSYTPAPAGLEGS